MTQMIDRYKGEKKTIFIDPFEEGEIKNNNFHFSKEINFSCIERKGEVLVISSKGEIKKYKKDDIWAKKVFEDIILNASNLPATNPLSLSFTVNKSKMLFLSIFSWPTVLTVIPQSSSLWLPQTISDVTGKLSKEIFPRFVTKKKYSFPMYGTELNSRLSTSWKVRRTRFLSAGQ
jgi:hypothetical protein